MRLLVLAAVLLAFACGKQGDSTNQLPTGPRLQITYEIDLDGSVDKKATLAQAVKTIQARLVAAKIGPHSVVEKGETIVVEVSEKNEEKLQNIRDLIARTGKLEFTAVDDGSELMRRVFQKVGSETGTGAAIDPAASAAEIRAEVDVWREDRGTSHTDYYLLAHDREAYLSEASARATGCFGKPAADGMILCRITGKRAIEEYVAALGAVDASFKVPDDRKLAFELLDPEPGARDQRPVWRSYYLERAPRLTGAAIATTSGGVDPNSNRPYVLLDFTPDGARMFGEVTKELVGRKLAILLDERINSAPVIMSAIRGGQAQITMSGYDLERGVRDRDQIATILQAGALPAPLREASEVVVP